MTQSPSRRTVLGMLGAVPLAAGGLLATPRAAYASNALPERIASIIARPEFLDARWGMAFSHPNDGSLLYAMNPAELFVAASAVKIFIGGTAFEALGADYRFRTRVYRTGPVVKGVLHGDLVLVAGGDPLLSARLRPDGTVALPAPDHSYPGGAPLAGDALQTMRSLAASVAADGIRQIAGRARIDTSLFQDGKEDIASGAAPVTVSPMMINDNLVNISVSPGATEGAPGVLTVSPATGYVTIINHTQTTATAGQPLAITGDVPDPDGMRTVTVTGDATVGDPARHLIYYVPEPARLAESAFTIALQERGITIVGEPSRHWQHRRYVAEHLSPPLDQSARVMLKVSSNIHTVAFPYLVGAIAGREPRDPKAAYDRYRRRLFTRAGLDPQPPGWAQGRYSADTFVRFLGHLAQRPYFRRFREALPIMGRDGTLADVQTGSPAAGNVYAKTGTGLSQVPGSTGVMVYRALAGYIQAPGGHWVTFAQFMAKETASRTEAMKLVTTAGEAMGEIATAVYENAGQGRN